MPLKKKKYCKVRPDIIVESEAIPYTMVDSRKQGYFTGAVKLTYKWKKDVLLIWLNGNWAEVNSIDFEFIEE